MNTDIGAGVILRSWLLAILAMGGVLLGQEEVVEPPVEADNASVTTEIGPDGQALFGKTTPDGYSSYIAIPGVIQMVPSGAAAQGGAWTGVMVLTYMFALMGIQSAPAFSMWAFANKSPAPFVPQQVWASSFGIGLILFSFTAFQGIGSHFLGADLKFFQAHPELVEPVMVEGKELELET